MRFSARDLRNRTRDVIAAVEAGERVTITVRGEPVADLVPHGRRSRWMPGEWLWEELKRDAADPGLAQLLDEVVGDTVDEI